MAKSGFDGYQRLKNGFHKTLSRSERERGYLFVSSDKNVRKLGEVSIIINGKQIGTKSIDNSGRVTIGKKHTINISDNEIYIELINDTIYINY